ncbi:ATP-binding cassette domain-containing protein [Sphingomonas aliaeris]|uniref:ATP-binding cassette domain-containing protein n=1 Tax=Sphingomonas aliaeris TaxID=2759526 RepID=A0A974S5X6_9SPHN|nr:ATP-binding cassette domain-containing protein [Sphingomonas aliaeris]QQV78490.1 ATP-binding cassette domain-containing protein [Sphingomonas aliaeris]
MSFDISVSKRLGDTRIALDLTAGEGVTILFGPSGAGKTSVLNMVAGLLRPDAGTIRVGGETLFDAALMIDVPVERRRAGYVFQEARLFPHLKVRANLTYGAGARGLDHEAIAFLDIAHLLDRWPLSLSGGEARRVSIGRALLSDPAFLLLDEPLSSLDAARREEIIRVIEHLRDVVRLPVLMVTHDAGEAERLGTRVVQMPG